MKIQPTERQAELAQKIREGLIHADGYTIVFNSDEDAIDGISGIQKALQDIGGDYNVQKFWEDGDGTVGYRFSKK